MGCRTLWLPLRVAEVRALGGHGGWEWLREGRAWAQAAGCMGSWCHAGQGRGLSAGRSVLVQGCCWHLGAHAWAARCCRHAHAGNRGDSKPAHVQAPLNRAQAGAKMATPPPHLPADQHHTKQTNQAKAGVSIWPSPAPHRTAACGKPAPNEPDTRSEASAPDHRRCRRCRSGPGCGAAQRRPHPRCWCHTCSSRLVRALQQSVHHTAGRSHT